MSKRVIDTIKNATFPQMDACWAVLKYREYGILRKATAIEVILGLDEGEISDFLPIFNEGNKKGRIKDYESRHILNDFFYINVDEFRNKEAKD